MEWKNTHEIGRFVAEASNESRERIVWKSEIGRGIINLDSKVGKFIGTILIPPLFLMREFALCCSFIYTSHRLLYVTVFNGIELNKLTESVCLNRKRERERDICLRFHLAKGKTGKNECPLEQNRKCDRWFTRKKRIRIINRVPVSRADYN